MHLFTHRHLPRAHIRRAQCPLKLFPFTGHLPYFTRNAGDSFGRSAPQHGITSLSLSFGPLSFLLLSPFASRDKLAPNSGQTALVVCRVSKASNGRLRGAGERQRSRQHFASFMAPLRCIHLIMSYILSSDHLQCSLAVSSAVLLTCLCTLCMSSVIGAIATLCTFKACQASLQIAHHIASSCWCICFCTNKAPRVVLCSSTLPPRRKLEATLTFPSHTHRCSFSFFPFFSTLFIEVRCGRV